MIVLIGSTINYSYKYIFKRDFMDLKNYEVKDAINANIFSHKLNNLKWITCLNPENPKKEVQQLLEVIKIIKNDDEIKSIITDYQFISVIISTYDFSPSQVWFINHVAIQKNNSEFYKKYHSFFNNKVKTHDIKKVYVIKPLWGGDKIFEDSLNEECYTKSKVTDILDVFTLRECDDLS